MKLKKAEHRSLWYKKMYYYLHAGQSLSDAAMTAATDADTRYIHEELSSGMSLSQVFRLPEFERCFTVTEISLIAVGEQTGSMQEVCLSLSGMLKSQHGQRQKLVAAAIYPGLVLFMAFGLLLMILTVIVPKIGPLFADMKDLPVATRILIGLSDHVVGSWYLDVIFLTLLYMTHLGLRRNARYLAVLDRLRRLAYQRLPYVRSMHSLWHIERWMQVTHMSLSSHVALSEALSYAADAVDDDRMRAAFLTVQEQVAEGNSCSSAMSRLPAAIHVRVRDWISIIASGERTGSLTDVFRVCHVHMQEHLLEAIDRFQKMVEPILIVGVGMMVLSICLSIILPMYQLTQSLQ